MTIKPLQTWTCDVCKKTIEKAADGYVVWNDGADGICDLQVIHQGRCDDDSRINSAALADFLGTDGLARITALMTYGPLKDNEPHKIKNISELIDFMRRMQLPYYEEARQQLFSRDLKNEYYDSNEILPYLQRELKGIAERN